MGIGCRARRYLLASWLLGVAAAQDEAPREAPAEWDEDPVACDPIRIDRESGEARIELAIERWGETGRAQRFGVRLEKKPAFVREARWIPGDTIRFEPSESEKVVTLVLLLAEGGGTEGEIVLVVRAEDESLSPRERRLVLPCSSGAGKGGGTAFAIRAPAGEEIDAKKLADHIDRSAAPLYACDRVAVFFRPPAGPMAKELVFWWQIRDPAGERGQGGCWNPGDWYEGDPLHRFDERKAPAPFGTEIVRWPRDRAGCLPAGSYRVFCAPQVDTDLSLLGKKGARAGEFKEVGSFELLSLPDLVFEEIVADPATRHTLERLDYVEGGSVEIASVSVDGRSVRFSGRAAWRPRKRGQREGEWVPAAEDERLEARMQITFPETLRMSREVLGECETEFHPALGFNAELVVNMQFLGAVYGLFPVADRAPDRALVAGRDVPGSLASSARGKGEDAYVWVTRAFSPGAHYCVVVPNRKTRMLFFPDRPASSGRPPRSTGDHLRDPKTRFVVPVRFAFLSNDGRAFDQLVFAVYRVPGERGP